MCFTAGGGQGYATERSEMTMYGSNTLTSRTATLDLKDRNRKPPHADIEDDRNLMGNDPSMYERDEVRICSNNSFIFKTHNDLGGDVQLQTLP